MVKKNEKPNSNQTDQKENSEEDFDYDYPEDPWNDFYHYGCNSFPNCDLEPGGCRYGNPKAWTKHIKWVRKNSTSSGTSSKKKVGN